MFKVTGAVTGVRAPKTDKAELCTTTSVGGMRLNYNAALKLGVVDGDYISIATGKNESGEDVFAIFKSEKNAANVSKLASNTGDGGSGSLTFGSTNAYNQLGGNSKELVTYELAGEGEVGEEGDNNVYFALTKTGTKPKTERAERTPEQIEATKQKRAATLAAKHAHA